MTAAEYHFAILLLMPELPPAVSTAYFAFQSKIIFGFVLDRADRGKVLFRLDQNAPLRFSHENPAVQALYREYLDEPCSHRAEELLHCDHFAWQMDAAR